jgi:formiminoglutamate deiminase
VTWHAELLWTGTELLADVALEAAAGRLTRVEPAAAPGGTPLPGLTLPGLVNAHSHAFHRALRGRTAEGAGDFWAWRKRMYAVADRLDPDSYLALARAAYVEMALAGITTVGEFHYLHHARGGAPYADPNAMGHALTGAAREAGVRLTLLDACYLQADVDGRPLTGAQLRFGDRHAEGWAARVATLAEGPRLRIGAAIHSVRAVPPEAMRQVAAYAGVRPLHLHLSEQPAENAACLAATGRTPTQLCADTAVLGPRTTAVHATHLTDHDVTLLGGSGTSVCLCPTTERDLADGVGPAPALAGAGSPLCLGTDSHAVVDLFEEARAVELDERLVSRRRGTFSPATLLGAATYAVALGWAEAGRLEPGALADFTTIRLDSARTAGGGDPVATAVFAATAADVTTVVVGGEPVVVDGVHQRVPDVGDALGAAIGALWT